MGYTAYINHSLENRMHYLRDISLALIAEVVEMLQELPWKPWKPVGDQPCNLKKAEDESVDIFVFLIDAMLIVNPNIDIEEAVLATLKKIDKRINETNYKRQ